MIGLFFKYASLLHCNAWHKLVAMLLTRKSGVKRLNFGCAFGCGACSHAQQGTCSSPCNFFFKLSLSEVHSNTGRLLFEYDDLQKSLAAPEVFVAFTNSSCTNNYYTTMIDTVKNTNYSSGLNRQAGGCVCYHLQTVRQLRMLFTHILSCMCIIIISHKCLHGVHVLHEAL